MARVGHFQRNTNKISITVAEMVAGELEERFLVPQRGEMQVAVEGKDMWSTLKELSSQCHREYQCLTPWKRRKK